jgi:protein-tyrosine-phosphatase
MDLHERARMHAALGDPHRLGMVDSLRHGDRTFQELAAISGLPGNLAAHHLRVLEQAGLLERRVSEGDRRRRYVTLRREGLQASESALRIAPALVVFVCTHNSARSQFAAALWRERTSLEGDSAGTEPASRVHPKAVTVAAEHGIDITTERPKAYAELARAPALLVSVCDRARETALPRDVPLIHWSIPDPVTRGSIGAFRDAFDAIAARVDRLAAAIA